MKSSKATVVCLLMITSTWRIARAGDLNPPVGPVAPTQRTPVNANMTPGDADSLFKITLPGSYYLTGNIQGVADKHGIEIVASGVTLDLNGFDLVGAGGVGFFDGVSATVFPLTSIAVVNGSVRNWGDEGVDLQGFSPVNCRVADLLVSGNAGNGISTGTGCTITNCSANSNGANGTSNGISAASGSTVSNCTATQNTGNGIRTTVGSTVSNCSAYLNTGSGITTTAGCTVTNCSANVNSGSGIFVDNGSTVVDCTARENTLDGIRCVSECIVRGNTCSLNGSGAGDGANIHAFGTDNRIEANNCTTADRGIDVNSAGNIIIKNVCAGNITDWTIVANNVIGPIIDRRAPASAAVSGFSAPDSTGSTHPNANFSY